MKTGYVTDGFSTLSGLASVAYGDPDYFREVQNQIYSGSPTRFLDMHRPSATLTDFFGSPERLTGVIMASLEEKYQVNSSFSDYIDIEFGPDWKNVIESRVGTEFLASIDDQDAYGLTLSGYLQNAFLSVFPGVPNLETLSKEVARTIESTAGVGLDMALMTRVVSNNPQTKLSTPPLNSRIDLQNSLDLGSDYRGVEFTTGYITPQDYWNDVAYPGLSSGGTPVTLRDSINQGYVGYPSRTPLEALFNPVGAQSVPEDGIFIENTSPTNSSASYLNQFPDELQADRDVYSISLMGERLNGYTTFDPTTMSNGDLLDQSQVPQFEEENSDPQGGLTSSARNFTTAF